MVQPENIETWIRAALPCQAVEVQGDGRHFQAIVVSESFRGLNRVRQHQLVYAALGSRMADEVHALSVQTFTPDDWAARRG
ncbi:MAG: BolA family transcriptional regulator [Betaproteobacteria bacterium]|nr:BolA family transcriptional regulator [Betaproteobacteria bacterium]